MNLSGNVGSSPSTSAPSAPPRPASPEPKANVDRNTTLTLMPRPGRDALVVDRRAQAAAEARTRQHVLQADGERGADGDDEQAVVPHAQCPVAAADLGAPLRNDGSWMICCVEPMK